MKTKIIALLIALVVLGGVGSAALLQHYGVVKGTGDVAQAIVIDDNNYDITTEYNITNETVENYAGCSYNETFTIKNRADIPGYIEFVTDNDVAVTTRYLAEVQLCSKTAGTWTPNCNVMSGTLTYELNNNKFVYKLKATGLTDGEEYSLIYYADEPDRFVDWGGDNPGALIGTGVANSGMIVMSGSENLGMDLPHSDDFNTGDYLDSENNWLPADYGQAPDFYDMRTGAKVWLILSSHYDADNKTVTKWDPTKSLFETDLINYDDTNNGQPGCGKALRIGANSEFELIIENTFAIDTQPGTYTVFTTIVPIV